MWPHALCCRDLRRLRGITSRRCRHRTAGAGGHKAHLVRAVADERVLPSVVERDAVGRRGHESRGALERREEGRDSEQEVPHASHPRPRDLLRVSSGKGQPADAFSGTTNTKPRSKYGKK